MGDDVVVMYLRKPYMKLCQHNNTEVTYIIKNGVIEVTFEQAVNGGFKTLVMNERMEVLLNKGFNGAEIGYFQIFLKRNINVMKEYETVENSGD